MIGSRKANNNTAYMKYTERTRNKMIRNSHANRMNKQPNEWAKLFGHTTKWLNPGFIHEWAKKRQNHTTQKVKKNINQRNSHGNTSSSYEIMQRCVHRVASIFVYSIQYRCVLSRLSSHTWTYTLTVFLFTITSNAFGEQTLLLYANNRCHHVLYYGGIASFFILFY